MLQRAKNTRAWIVLPNLQSTQISCLLTSLHLLPVTSHIKYKIATITYKSLLNLPIFINYFITTNHRPRHLCSGDQNLLALPTTSS